MPFRSLVRTFGVAVALSATPTYAQSPATVADASLEDLLAVEVTSVSKNEEALFRASSAIAVVTQEDIRRALDLRLGWTRCPFGLSVTGQHPLHADHLDFDRIDAFVGSRVPRRATARLTWTF